MPNIIRYPTIVITILAFIATAISGCSSSRTSLPGEPSSTRERKDLYYFHSGDSTWIIRPVTEAGKHYAGIIYKAEDISKNPRVRIYAEPLTSVTVENGRLTVPMENIVKVENHRIGPGVIIGSIGVLGLLFLLPAIL